MESNALEILYVRHADAAAGSADGRDRCDRDVTPLGEKQLELLSERFRGAEIDAVFSSPLVRTVKTAAAVANGIGGNIPVELLPEIIEKGATPGYTGLPVDELKIYYPNLILCKDKICSLPSAEDEEESKEQCLARARAVTGYLTKRFKPGQKIVLVSHGVFGINFFQAAMGIINEYSFRYTTDNTAITKLRFEPEGVRRIAFSNDVSHLIPGFPEYRFRL